MNGSRLASSEGKNDQGATEHKVFRSPPCAAGYCRWFRRRRHDDFVRAGGASGQQADQIGYVSPKSGPLAAFAGADDFALGEFRKFIKDGVKVESQTYSVEVVTKDSQSNPNRAAGRAAGGCCSGYSTERAGVPPRL